MKQEIYKLLVLAIACEIPGEAAYRTLDEEYMARFDEWYKQQQAIQDPDQIPVTLDALINFAIISLPNEKDVSIESSVLFGLKSRRSAIVESFLNKSVADMVTQLASREAIFEAIHSLFLKKNKYRGMYSKINRTRLSTIFTDFLDVFKANSAHAFEFGGDFKRFVMHSFINYYLKGKEKDIWKMIRENDDAKSELEHNVVSEQQVTVTRSDDLKIHDLLVNICVVNDLLFKHAGQSDSVRGVLYDIYYLILCELCRTKVDGINESMGSESLEFVDPYDRHKSRLGIIQNKGVDAKVHNAKEFIPFIFDYIRRGALNVSALADLRSRCYDLGKHDREGRNCVWEDVAPGGETSHYLDTATARKNYDSFNKILKGVVSVYTLMTELEARGRFLVDDYNSEVFKDKDLIRYIDYLSALEHIDLIKALHQQDVSQSETADDLLEFERMLDEHAGSVENKHSNIKENRDYDRIYGFMSNPKLKQDSTPRTDFAKLSLIAKVFDAVPHTYVEYVTLLEASLGRNGVPDTGNSSWLRMSDQHVSESRYHSLYFNWHMRQNPKWAEYYLLGNPKFMEAGWGRTPDVSWDVRRSNYTSISLMGCVGVWLPIEGQFFFYDVIQGMTQRWWTSSMRDILSMLRQNTVNGQPLVGYTPLLCPVQPKGVVADWVSKTGDAVGFDIYIGISNIGSPDILKALPKTTALGKYHKSIERYYSWLHENSVFQHSIVDVLKAMYVESLYWSNLGMEAGVIPSHAYNLLMGLRTGEFNLASLNWFLKLLYEDNRVAEMEWHPKKGSVSHGLDKVVLDYCFGNTPKDKKYGLMYDDCIKIVEIYETPAERFIAIYNHVLVKLEFLTILRDSISLIVSTIPMEAATLTCEFNSRFKVADKIARYPQSAVTYGARLWSSKASDANAWYQKSEDVRDIIMETREHCMHEFRELVDLFTGYIKKSEDDIARLVNYNVSSQSEIASRFSAWGETFSLLPEYKNIIELEQLRKIASVDSAGFFVMNGVYFRSSMLGMSYYVHRSGRLLADKNGTLEAPRFDLSQEKDIKLYREIIGKGFKNDRS